MALTFSRGGPFLSRLFLRSKADPLGQNPTLGFSLTDHGFCMLSADPQSSIGLAGYYSLVDMYFLPCMWRFYRVVKTVENELTQVLTRLQLYKITTDEKQYYFSPKVWKRYLPKLI